MQSITSISAALADIGKGVLNTERPILCDALSAVDMQLLQNELHTRLYTVNTRIEQGPDGVPHLLLYVGRQTRPSLYLQDSGDGDGGFFIHTQSCVGRGNKCIKVFGEMDHATEVFRAAGIFVGEGGDIPF